jgi:hypothetical protein
MPKLIQFEGQTHKFPDDFTDAEISQALSQPAPVAQAAKPNPFDRFDEKPAKANVFDQFDEKPPFDPSKPFEAVADKPPFDPSKPFEAVAAPAKQSAVADFARSVPTGVAKAVIGAPGIPGTYQDMGNQLVDRIMLGAIHNARIGPATGRRPGRRNVTDLTVSGKP